MLPAAASAAGRDQKWSTESFGKTRDRMSFKMGPGNSRLLGSRALFPEPHHFYLVSWQAESICCSCMMKSASCVSGNVSHLLMTLNYLWSITELEVIDLHKGLGKASQCVHKQCSELALTCIPRSTLCFSLAYGTHPN